MAIIVMMVSMRVSYHSRTVPVNWGPGNVVSETSDLSGVRLVEEASWSTRPEVVGAVGLGEEVVEDLTVDLESDLLGEDLGELDLRRPSSDRR